MQANTNLTAFTFTGYNETLTEIKILAGQVSNVSISSFVQELLTGNRFGFHNVLWFHSSVQVRFDHQKMHVEGGDLPGLFASTQFQLHWGNGSATSGSEHSVNANDTLWRFENLVTQM